MTRRHRHNLDSVAIGRYAGEESTTENTVSVGRKAGYSVQEQYAIAIGDAAGEETQGLNAIAIGAMSGQTSQSTFAIAIGDQAGRKTQGANAIAIGAMSGQTSQSTFAIAIGDQAGKTSQGANAIAIGGKAGLKDQPASSIIISTSNTEIVAKKKGLYIDPIRKFDDRTSRPSTVKEGNILSYNYKNDTADATKEVVTGFPRLPGYPTDAEVAAAITLTAEDAGTMYFDTTKKKIKVYNGTKWVALADEDDLAKLKSTASPSAGPGIAAPALAAGSTEGFSATPTTAFEGTIDTSKFIVEPSGKIMPRADSVNGIDYTYAELNPGDGIYTLINLHDFTPHATDTQPVEEGNGIAKTWTVAGQTFQTLQPYTVDQYNPPLAAFQTLPQDQRVSLISEYAADKGITGMTNGSKTDVNGTPYVNSYSSDPFKDFLKSKGLG